MFPDYIPHEAKRTTKEEEKARQSHMSLLNNRREEERMQVYREQNRTRTGVLIGKKKEIMLHACLTHARMHTHTSVVLFSKTYFSKL